ncbi:MAG: ABC transporter permease [Myxococcota bacterium]
MSEVERTEDDLVEGVSLWQDAWRRLRKNRLASVSAWVIVSFVALCFVGPLLSPYGFEQQDLAYGARGPSGAHWLGTDHQGRDLLTRILFGGQISLLVGLLAAGVSLAIGTLYGAVSAYAGGRVDNFMMRVVDIIYSLPYMFLVILLVAIVGRSLVLLFVALGAVQWLTAARIVRGQVLSLKEKEFVEAARATGVRPFTIVLRHLIPNTLGTMIVYFTLTVPSVILQEAFLSFLGLGVQAPRPSLGGLINDGANAMVVYPWTLLFPAIAMAALLFCLNFVGDGLRDALDPKMRNV